MSDCTAAFLSRLRKDIGGNTLALAAAAILPLLAIVGGALDMSMVYMARSRLQNACDAGALAGRHLMEGTAFNQAVEDEAHRFFAFNFPETEGGPTSISFEIVQNPADQAELLGTASASVPTILMHIFGFGSVDISTTCDAKKDFGHNDIVLVLDVTGSMLQNASGGGGPRIDRLREGARGLYAALADAQNTVTRYGIVPYSHTVNVASALGTNDILRNQDYVDQYTYSCGWYSCTGYRSETVHIKASSWGTSYKTDAQNIDAFRTSGNGCIEERSSVGSTGTGITINNTITRADIDNRAASANDTALQFGRYDPAVQESESQSGCPSEATLLQEYGTEADFQKAIDNATARVTGGTYHDVGMLWGARFISRTGFFSAQNPARRDNVPVNMHLVFMTDGMLDTGATLYSAHGVEARQGRTKGSGSQDARHVARFNAACDLAKSMEITVWVIALDVGNIDDIAPCATSPSHFKVSNGSDLEEVFKQVGQGIGKLRLTR